MIIINAETSIRRSELEFRASRSSGPGGQHVNKVSSRVTLRFDVDRSPSLDEDQRQKLRQALRTRISKDGILSVTSQSGRSQVANRRRATERFVELMRAALLPSREHQPTRPTRASKSRRLEAKRQRSQTKKRRRPADLED